MTTRRGFPLQMAGLAACGRLLAQDGERPVYDSKLNLAVVSFAVTDNRGRFVTGLQPGDIRIYEDGIAQSVLLFSESGRLVLELGSGARSSRAQFEAMRDDQEYSYAAAFHPAPPGSGRTFRKIRIEVAHEHAGSWRVRHRVGYRR